MKFIIVTIEYHRNGICGAPFHVVLFHEGESRKVGILFERDFHCAVLDVTRLYEGEITFGSNSWRGDQYEPDLRKAVAEFERRES